jgi:hypothetical protein
MNILEKLNIIKKEIPQYMRINKEVHLISRNDTFAALTTLLGFYGIFVLIFSYWFGYDSFLFALCSLIFAPLLDQIYGTISQKIIRNTVIDFSKMGGEKESLSYIGLLKIKIMTNKLSLYGRFISKSTDLFHKRNSNKENKDIELIIINSLINNMSESEILRDKDKIIKFVEENVCLEIKVKIFKTISEKIKNIKIEKEERMIKNIELETECEKYLNIINNESKKRKKNKFVLKEV